MNTGPPLKVGAYNREFAKRRVKELDKAIGKDGEYLDLTKATKFFAKGETDEPCFRLFEGASPV